MFFDRLIKRFLVDLAVWSVKNSQHVILDIGLDVFDLHYVLGASSEIRGCVVIGYNAKKFPFAIHYWHCISVNQLV